MSLLFKLLLLDHMVIIWLTRCCFSLNLPKNQHLSIYDWCATPILTYTGSIPFHSLPPSAVVAPSFESDSDSISSSSRKKVRKKTEKTSFSSLFVLLFKGPKMCDVIFFLVLCLFFGGFNVNILLILEESNVTGCLCR